MATLHKGDYYYYYYYYYYYVDDDNNKSVSELSREHFYFRFWWICAVKIWQLLVIINTCRIYGIHFDVQKRTHQLLLPTSSAIRFRINILCKRICRTAVSRGATEMELWYIPKCSEMKRGDLSSAEVV